MEAQHKVFYGIDDLPKGCGVLAIHQEDDVYPRALAFRLEDIMPFIQIAGMVLRAVEKPPNDELKV